MSFLTNGKKIDDKKGPMTISARPGVRKTENEKKKKTAHDTSARKNCDTEVGNHDT